MKATKTFSDGSFQQDVIQSAQPVVVDVWAPWCGPCNHVGPLIDELAEQFDGRVTVGKLNIDDNPEIAGKYKVSSIPTVLVFQDGEVVERFVGVQPKANYEAALERVAA